MDHPQEHPPAGGRWTPITIGANQLLALISEMLRELRGEDAPPVELDDELDRTLGIDSLARMELMLRLERAAAGAQGGARRIPWSLGDGGVSAQSAGHAGTVPRRVAGHRRRGRRCRSRTSAGS
jgi:hypothetical protein